MDSDALRRHVTQHDIIYEVPPRFWEDGFPLGNGHFGGMVWQPSGIEIGLNKLDVWDRRVQNPPHVPFDRLKELFETAPEQANAELRAEAERSDDFPYPKPLGRVRIDIEHDFLPMYQSIHHQTQRLRLFDGTVECAYETNHKATRFDCWVDSDSNVLVVDAQDEWLHERFADDRQRQRVSIFREYDEILGMPESGADGEVMWIRYPFPDGFEYVLAMAVSGIEHTEPVVFTNEVSVEVKLDYRDRQPKTWQVIAGAKTSMDCATDRRDGHRHYARGAPAMVARLLGEVRRRA